MNGSRGIVVKMAEGSNRPVVRFSDQIERTISTESFTISVAGRVVAQRVQIPLDLAWGISVHKCQGQTVERAEIHLKNVFEYGQAYVALSRVRSREGLCLRFPLEKRQIMAHPSVVRFYRQIKSTTGDY